MSDDRVYIARMRDSIWRLLRTPAGKALPMLMRDELEELLVESKSPRPCERAGCIFDAGHYGSCLVTVADKERST